MLQVRSTVIPTELSLTGHNSCDGTGHGSRSCPEPQRERVVRPLLDWARHPQMDSECAWEKFKLADQNRDMDDIKEAFEVYAKNTPETTFQEIEKRLREEKCNTHLIGLTKEIPIDKTNVDLQFQADRKYVLGFQIARKSRRTKMSEGMLAESYEENFERLSNCGYTVQTNIPICYNVSLWSNS